MSTERDRSLPALIEVALAAGLVACKFLPWWLITPTTADRTPTGPSYSVGIGGVGSGGITDTSLVMAIGPAIVLVLALAAASLPWRGFIVSTLIAFAITGCVGALGSITLANSGQIGSFPTTRPDVGLQLFAWLCLAGMLVTAVDLTRNATTTAVWRRLKSPSTRRFGPFAGYTLLVVASLLVALFPMSATWTWLIFAALLGGLAWWVRAMRPA